MVYREVTSSVWGHEEFCFPQPLPPRRVESDVCVLSAALYSAWVSVQSVHFILTFLHFNMAFIYTGKKFDCCMRLCSETASWKGLLCSGA